MIGAKFVTTAMRKLRRSDARKAAEIAGGATEVDVYALGRSRPCACNDASLTSNHSDRDVGIYKNIIYFLHDSGPGDRSYVSKRV